MLKVKKGSCHVEREKVKLPMELQIQSCHFHVPPSTKSKGYQHFFQSLNPSTFSSYLLSSSSGSLRSESSATGAWESLRGSCSRSAYSVSFLALPPRFPGETLFTVFYHLLLSYWEWQGGVTVGGSLTRRLDFEYALHSSDRFWDQEIDYKQWTEERQGQLVDSASRLQAANNVGIGIRNFLWRASTIFFFRFFLCGFFHGLFCSFQQFYCTLSQFASDGLAGVKL